MDEFNLIQEYFTWDNPPADVSIAIGDDAAVLDIPANAQLVTSIDTLISGVHFPQNTSAHAIGHKALAVNLSDLAAMGATPKWFTLALTLPEINKKWLKEFRAGLKTIANQYNCFLVGGDTTRGPLSISIQVMGLVEKNKALLRSGAKLGDKVFVTGTLGDAAFALQYADNEFCKQRLDYPTPRLEESRLIKEFASSCIDVSDGLLQDLSHILGASSVGAELELASLPLSDTLKQIDREKAINYALTGGDDYELLFTIPANKESEFIENSEKVGGVCFDSAQQPYFDSAQQPYTCIGTINQKNEIIIDENGNKLTRKGYNHFHDE